MAEQSPVGSPPEPDIVVETVTFKWAHFYTKEDSWAIWLGFALLAIGLLIFLPRPPVGAEQIIAEANAAMQAESEQAPFKTVGWYDALGKKQGLKATNESYAKTIARWLHQPHGWSNNPVESFVLSADGAEARNVPYREPYAAAKTAAAETKAAALAAEQTAATGGYNDTALNDDAVEKIRA